MSEFTAGTIVGMLAGAFLGAMVYGVSSLGAMVYGVSSGVFDAINDCQANLPRNQVCELTAKPKQEAAGHEQ